VNHEPKKLVYKNIEGFNNGETFQSALTAVLKRYHRTSDRVEPLGADSSEVRFINVTRNHQKMLLGIFHKLTKGAGQYVIEIADAADSWNVVLLKARADGKDNREFVEGTLFFAIWKNHLIVHQTSSCRWDQLENYASWLLAKPSTGKDSPSAIPLVAFVDPIPPDLRKKTKQPVKSIRFGTALQTSAVQPVTSKTAPSQKTKLWFTPTGAVWNGLKAIFKELHAPVPDDLLLDDALGTQDIRVDLELSCTKRKSQSTAGEVLSVLGRSLSHSTVESYTVELADGSKITPDQMKVEKIVQVECVEKQPVAEEMFKRMVEWMAALVDSQIVVEDEAFGNVK
jgi:hypothetical protein